METFFSFLRKRIDDCSSLLCIGLDPHPGDLTNPSATAARDFCLNLVRETAPFAAAFKPNSAFFEVYGAEGWHTLQQVIEAIHGESDRLGSRIPIILDAKRGDIASTAQAYAQAVFHALGADAVTLNPYLGWDSMEPFLNNPEKGVFVLCKTSNPGSGDIQDLFVGTGTVYEQVARSAQGKNTLDNIGLVVGATHPEALRRIRQVAPTLWFLIPGVGAQGGNLESILECGLWSDRKGLLINVSRSIARSDDPKKAAIALRDEIINFQYNHKMLAVSKVSQVDDPRYRLADALLAAGCIKFGEFTLKSGVKSPIYLDLRELVSNPVLLSQVASQYLPILKELDFDRLSGLPYAALPIATAISLQSGLPMVYPRKESKEYGTKADIEGYFEAGEKVVMVDDLATTGGSKFEAIDKLAGAGLNVQDIVVLIDRESGAREALAEAGYRLHAVMALSEMLDHWEGQRRVPANWIAATRAFLSGS
jgi:uridine monophosphate synthetase